LLPADVDKPAELVVGQRGGRREWIDARQKQRLGHEDVADTRDHALIQEDLADPQSPPSPHPPKDLGAIDGWSQQVRTERPKLAVPLEFPACKQVGHRDVEPDGDRLCSPDEEAHIA
jgi:hypothetical protein